MHIKKPDWSLDFPSYLIGMFAFAFIQLLMYR